MNLHQLVSGAIGAVNPFVLATIQSSTGYTTNPDFTRVPTYATFTNVPVQVQALSYDEIKQLDGLNIQGVRRKIYLNGDWSSLVRTAGKGGDLVTLPDGTVWLVALVFEHWPDWTSAAITQQVTP